MKNKGVCRYIDLLVRIAQGNPIKRVWIDKFGGDPFEYDANWGCYKDSRGNYLSNLLFEKQMVVPNIYFIVGE